MGGGSRGERGEGAGRRGGVNGERRRRQDPSATPFTALTTRPALGSAAHHVIASPALEAAIESRIAQQESVVANEMHAPMTSRRTASQRPTPAKHMKAALEWSLRTASRAQKRYPW